VDGSDVPVDTLARRPGRPPWLDPVKAELARRLLLAGRRPGYVRRKTGLSYDGVRSVIERIREERRAK
jgi:hypothetical protein